MSKGGRQLSSEEKRLWRRVAAGVTPRRAPAAEADAAPKPAAKSGRALDKRAAQQGAPRPKAAPPPQDRGNERRVRRGRIETAATLDLHGHTQDSARAALARFLCAAQADGASAVIVVTGVGRGGEGVLKRRLPEWLAEADLRPFVSGYAQAHRTHGGAGAFYVFIKRRR